MDKNEFLQQANAPQPLAERAWELANEDPQQAQAYLEPSKLKVNAKFRDSGGRFGGLIYISWNYAENTIDAGEAVVSSSDKILDIPIDLPPNNFHQRITRGKKTGEQMGGNTETLQTALADVLQDPGSELRSGLVGQDLAKIDVELQNLLTSNLDINNPQFTSEVVLSRKIDEIDGTEETAEAEEESEEYEFPAEVEINPIKGVPVNQISIGDLIYVDLGNYSSELQRIAQVLDQRRDESGMIPAQLVSREVSEAGTLSLRVQFGRDVYGKVRCGKDVNILVPESTASDKSQGMQKKSLDPLEVLEENWVLILPFIIALIIILVVFLVLTP